MSIHEKHCLKNLNRECRLCQQGNYKSLINESKVLLIEKIKSNMIFSEPKSIGEGISADRIKQPTIEQIVRWAEEQGWEGCPNCLMSIIILSGIQKFPYSINYDYKKEIENWWIEKNEGDKNADEYASYY